ncbi:hypothetical protein ESA2_CDS220 [Staphylococcus phage ESa2]|nr:hypothetical protein ESA2_CDS220 [Staphylococcus phage ESa2]
MSTVIYSFYVLFLKIPYYKTPNHNNMFGNADKVRKNIANDTNFKYSFILSKPHKINGTTKEYTIIINIVIKIGVNISSSPYQILLLFL